MPRLSLCVDHFYYLIIPTGAHARPNACSVSSADLFAYSGAHARPNACSVSSADLVAYSGALASAH